MTKTKKSKKYMNVINSKFFNAYTSILMHISSHLPQVRYLSFSYKIS